MNTAEFQKRNHPDIKNLSNDIDFSPILLKDLFSGEEVPMNIDGKTFFLYMPEADPVLKKQRKVMVSDEMGNAIGVLQLIPDEGAWGLGTSYTTNRDRYLEQVLLHLNRLNKETKIYADICDLTRKTRGSMLDTIA